MLTSASSSRRAGSFLAGGLMLLAAPLLVLLSARASAQSQAREVRLRGHVPSSRQGARQLGRAPRGERVDLALTLPLRREVELGRLLEGLTNPQDPAYGHFLSVAEFTSRFGPSQEQYDAVARFARFHGLAITGRHPNRLLLDVSGTAAAVEQAFHTRLMRYQARDGRVFLAPDMEPAIPAALSGVLTGVVGLNGGDHAEPMLRRLDPRSAPATGFQTGSGPGGGLTPRDIKQAYNLGGVTQDGSGQTLALFELDGYDANDIAAYESNYGLPNTPLQNILVDGYSGAAGGGQDEVTLDIELMIALAPRVARILVYEGPNGSGILDTFNRIATDNVAKSVSTSWGTGESGQSAPFMNAENNIFRQMAAQGQSMFAASGDTGAYNNNVFGASDPATQPYLTGVGGTRLTTNGPGGTWQGETTWGNSSNRTGGGGGISTLWPQPSYQSGAVSPGSAGSTTMRNVPDVSLAADPSSGYAIYTRGAWYIIGGTSAAAPLWSAFFALVNQARLANGLGVAGQANPALYRVGASTAYHGEFHDIADGSNNLYYSAVGGYDLATGWGSFNGGPLLTDLSSVPVNPASIQLTAPTAGSAWTIGESRTIAWTSSGISGGIRVELSRDGGNSFETLSSSAPNTGSYGWTVTAPATSQARVRVSDAAHPAVSSLTTGNFTITALPPTVRVTSPNGGETWSLGVSNTVTWTAANTSGIVAVDLSRDGGSSWETLTAVSATAGATSVTVNGAASTHARIRVRDQVNAAGSDVSDGDFTLLDSSLPAAPTGLTVTATSVNDVRLDWLDHATNESGYRVEVRAQDGSYQEVANLNLGPGATTASLSGGTPLIVYYFRVRAFNAFGYSAYSNEVQFTHPDNPPAAPIKLTAKPLSSTEILLAWRRRSTNETGFRVEILKGTSYVELGTTNAGAAGVRVFNLAVNTTYYFRVRATNSGGNSAYTNVAHAKTKKR